MPTYNTIVANTNTPQCVLKQHRQQSTIRSLCLYCCVPDTEENWKRWQNTRLHRKMQCSLPPKIHTSQCNISRLKMKPNVTTACVVCCWYYDANALNCFSFVRLEIRQEMWISVAWHCVMSRACVCLCVLVRVRATYAHFQYGGICNVLSLCHVYDTPYQGSITQKLCNWARNRAHRSVHTIHTVYNGTHNLHRNDPPQKRSEEETQNVTLLMTYTVFSTACTTYNRHISCWLSLWTVEGRKSKQNHIGSRVGSKFRWKSYL